MKYRSSYFQLRVLQAISLKNISYKKFLQKKFTNKLEEKLLNKQTNKPTNNNNNKIDVFTSMWNYAQAQNTLHQSRAQ